MFVRDSFNRANQESVRFHQETEVFLLPGKMINQSRIALEGKYVARDEKRGDAEIHLILAINKIDAERLPFPLVWHYEKKKRKGSIKK